MKKILVIILITITFSCFGQKKPNTKIDKTKIAFLRYNEGWDHPFKNAKPAKLSENELQEIEKILIECSNKNETLSPLKKYYRQYVIVINENGEKEVWVNCMCKLVSPDFINWKKEIINVADGGSCYFHVKINLTTKSCNDLIINLES